MENREESPTTLQRMPLSSSSSSSSHGKRVCFVEAARAPPPLNLAVQPPELDLFPVEKIANLEVPAAINLMMITTGENPIIGLMLPDAGGSPQLISSIEDDHDHPLEMHEINGAGTSVAPPQPPPPPPLPPRKSKRGAAKGCSCGGAAASTSRKPKPAREEVRVAFRNRTENDLIQDGWKWRKYGQKGEPPRSYYSCSIDTCLVRKQVQRCAQDKSILVTTYIQWKHSHSLLPVAMSTANVISEIASMFLKGFIPISGGMININSISPMTHNCRQIMATVSSSTRCPTVTLDLTETPEPPLFHAPAPQLQPQFFDRLVHEESHIVRGAMGSCEDQHDLDEIASNVTDEILVNPKFKGFMISMVKSIIKERRQ